MRTTLLGTLLAILSCSATQSQTKEPAGVLQLSDGTVRGNNYHNPDLGFRYEFPAKWIASQQVVSPEHDFGWKDEGSGKPKHGPQRCSKNLLFATQHPEGMRPDGFVPMVSLIAVDPGCVPNVTFPQSTNDRESVERVVRLITGHLETPPLIRATAPRVLPVEYDSRVLLQLSQDFSISTEGEGHKTILSVTSAISAMQAGNYWVLLIMVASDDPGLRPLKSTKIVFEAAPNGSHGQK